MKDKLPFSLFVLSSAFFVFLFGVFTGRYQTFPYQVLQSAKEVVDQFRSPFSSARGPDGLHTFPYRDYYTGEGVTISDPQQSYAGYTLFTAYNGEKCSNLLIDAEGNVLQEWYVKYSEVWDGKAPFLDKQLGDEWTCWQGTHLQPDGTLTAAFIDNGQPYCGGLVSLDLDSNIVWSLPKCAHHDVHLGNDGMLYVPGMNQIKQGEEEALANRYLQPGWIPSDEPNVFRWETPLLEDTVLITSQDGELQEEVSLLDAFYESDFRWALSTHFQTAKHSSGAWDPTHLNDVELVTEEWASYHPAVEAGDILISLRNMNAIAIIDRDTKAVNWLTDGTFSQQHDPDLLANGNLLIFDNAGSSGSETGATRIIEWDPKSQQTVWEYGGTSESPLHSVFRGSQQPLPNGNVLITETTGGRIIEVTREGEIVWEYVNKVGEDRVGAIMRAQRFAPDSLEFLQSSN